MDDSDQSRPIDVTASTLEQAIEEGLAQLGLSRNDVIIEIVEEGSRGVLGMGARDAVVRLTPLRAPTRPAGIPEAPPSPPPPAPSPAAPPPAEPEPEPSLPTRPEPAAAAPRPERQAPATSEGLTDDELRIATAALKELLDHIGIDATVETHLPEPDSPAEESPWVLDIHGEDLGVLIGRRGETLNALQYIARLIVSRELQRRVNIVIDVEGYKSRRESALRKLALRMADQARRLGRTVTLEPMPPNERRIIHITLREDQTVLTESVGAGDQRKVTIIPAQGESR